MTTKSETHPHNTHDKNKHASPAPAAEPEHTIDSLGQANPAEDMEKKLVAEATKKAQEETPEEKK